ncbi:helix-hairpin-helix domain-containing protein [candidate division KSB1 bacterium]|nr:helix-hairpin-helix domain-containing protein [candidate division KSB1 bacterium]
MATAQVSSEEDLLELEEEADRSDLMDQLEELKQSPIDLNSARVEDLLQIPYLDRFTAQKIVEYRQQHGNFRKVGDLTVLPEIDPEFYETIKEFLFIPEKGGVPPLQGTLRVRAGRKLGRSRGFQENLYRGSPEKLYQRIDLRLAERVSLGIVLEKDSGEDRLGDLAVFSLSLRDVLNQDHLVLGNFRLQFGQGLVLWNGFGFSKGGDPISPVKKKAAGVRPFSSSSENQAFAGGSYGVGWGRFNGTVFFARTPLDATLGEGGVTSISETGLHRTEAEERKRDVLVEKMVGGHADYAMGGVVKLGITYYNAHYSPRILPSDPVRKHFEFYGTRNEVWGIEYDGSLKNINFFGEWASSLGGGRAWLAGALGGWPGLKLALALRDYGPDFHNLSASGFGERRDKPRNERGAYLGVDVKLSPGTRLAAYFDQFVRPWRTYGVPMPTRGTDFLIKVFRKVNPSLSYYLQMREKIGQKVGEEYDTYGREITVIRQITKRNFRGEIRVKLGSHLQFRGRVETCFLHTEGIKEKELGILFFQEVKLRPFPWLDLRGRMTTFDTPSFDSRIYEYEGDLRGVFKNTPFWGRGRRWYVLASYRLAKKVRVSMKWSETYLDDRDHFGSGTDEIPGNVGREAGVQLDMKF